MNKAISIFNEISHEYKMAYEMVNQIGDCYKKLVQEPPGTSLGVSRQSPGILLFSLNTKDRACILLKSLEVGQELLNQ